MKLLCTADINIVPQFQLMFNFKLLSEQLEERKKLYQEIRYLCYELLVL